MTMSNDSRPAAVVRFHRDAFDPATNVIKADERRHWLALDELRRQADGRIEQELTAGVIAVQSAVERRAEEMVAERVQQLSQVFLDAAYELERGALDLAVKLAMRIVEVSSPEAFFAHAVEHLHGLVPEGSAVRIRVHPSAVDRLGSLKEGLCSKGARYVSVVSDAGLPGDRSLIVETQDGELDLSCDVQVARVVREVRQRLGGGEQPTA
jgi:flagellar biosynthesis/type III secretory pathway protein FliH